MSCRTPLGRARGLGSAKTGTADWLWQRISAIALVPLGLWLAFSVSRLPGSRYEEALAWVRMPWNTFLSVSVLLVAFFHAQLGLRVIVEDYVHDVPLKIGALLAVKFICAAAALAALLAVLRIAYAH